MVSELAATQFSLVISESTVILCHDKFTCQTWKHCR